MSARPIEIGTRLGEFEIVDRIGSGAAGAVYRAKSVETGKEVALKTLTPTTVVNEDIHRRFIREIAIAQKLNHPNVVAYDYCGVDDDVLYYTMELVPWGALNDVLAENGTLPWREAAESGIEICRGLQHLHDANIVHRDLKPANIFLSDDGRLKLGDFGLARDLDSTRLTVDGQTVGTVKYLAPEQAKGEADLDGRTDLYALGCILFEMLAGRTPFVADQPLTEFSAFQMMQQHVEHAPPRVSDFVPDCPAQFVTLIDRLLAKTPAERPASASDVAARLLDMLEHPDAQAAEELAEGEVPAESKSLTERLRESRRPEQRLNVKALVLVLIVVGVAIAAAVLSR